MAEIVGRPKPFSAKLREAGRRFIRHENGVLVTILIGLIVALGGMTRGGTLTLGNARNVWLQSSTRGIASIGQLFVILTAGIDLSIGGVALMGAILGASLMTGKTGLPLGDIAIMLLFGLAIGAANGALVSRVPMPALIATLGMWQMTDGGAFIICRGRTIHLLPEAVNVFGGGEVAGVPVPVIIFISVAVVAYFVLNYTSYGRSVYAVGGSPVSAWLSGIKVPNMLFSVYVISGLMGALAGLILMSRTMCGGMNTVMGLELDSIAAVCIGGVSLMGGRGTLLGAVLGNMILGVVNNGMNVGALSPAYQDVVKGAIIITAVAIDYRRRR
jgi:ribose/xylose/arabinose/galactoside ABC-type transport system permease subunit